MVEGLRCGLPVVGMQSCNLHLVHGRNGLLAANLSELAGHLASVCSDPQLVARLANPAGAVHSDEPNDRMLKAIVEAHAATAAHGGVRRPRELPWHWLWSRLFAISLIIDDPPSRAIAAVCVGAAGLLVLCICCRGRCSTWRARPTNLPSTKARRKID